MFGSCWGGLISTYINMYLNYKLCSLNGGLAFMSGSIRRSVFVRVHGVYSLYLGFVRKR